MAKDGLDADASRSNHFRKFIAKEFLDRIGAGFSSQQFINVLLFLNGANLFLVGVVNGLRAILSILAGIIAQEYNRIFGISKKVIGLSGILLGFTFVLMAIGTFLGSALVFSVAILLAGVMAVPYGNFSHSFFLIGKRKEIMEKVAKYGLLITAASLFLAAYFLDNYGTSTSLTLDVFGKLITLKLPGYLIIFEIAAASFIIAGYFLATLGEKGRLAQESFSLKSIFFIHAGEVKAILKKKSLAILAVFNILLGIVQIAGNSYYGIFVYQNYRDSYFGGFVNIAVVFLVGVFSSLLGYSITRINAKAYGSQFMLVISGVFISLMPFSYYIGSNLAILTAGTMLGVIGASALGVSTSMIVIESLDEDKRTIFYAVVGILSALSFVVLIPLLSYAAQSLGLSKLFLYLGSISLIATFAAAIFYKAFNKNSGNAV